MVEFDPARLIKRVAAKQDRDAFAELFEYYAPRIKAMMMSRGTSRERADDLKAAPGTKLPHHTHTGYDWTCVLEGSFEHQFGRYGPSDFDEADKTMEHKPTVGDDTPCVCIVVLQGKIKL